jgi:hypothetical protein
MRKNKKKACGHSKRIPSGKEQIFIERYRSEWYRIRLENNKSEFVYGSTISGISN